MDEILATFQDDEFHGLPNADLKLFASITPYQEKRIKFENNRYCLLVRNWPYLVIFESGENND